MKACCKTCPFKLDKKGRMRDEELAARVTSRNLFTSQQICHGTEGPNREWRNRCRGSFDYNNTIYQRLNLKTLEDAPKL